MKYEIAAREHQHLVSWNIDKQQDVDARGIPGDFCNGQLTASVTLVSRRRQSGGRVEHFTTDWRDADGLKVFAQGWQSPEEPRAVICLVHGHGEHSGRYERVAETFIQAGYSFLSFDLRGHGRSDGPRGHVPSYDVFLEEISTLLATARKHWPGKPLVLYGHSLGGAMVLYHVLKRKPDVACVVASAPALKPAFDPPAWKIQLGKVLDRLWPSLALPSGLDVKFLSHDPAVIQAYLADPLVHDRISARLYNDWMRSVDYTFEHAREFSTPLLMIHGTDDGIISPAKSAKLAATIGTCCTWKPWEGVYHEPHNEVNNAEILTFILSWLDAQLG